MFSPLDHPRRAIRRIQSPFRNFQTQPEHRHRRLPQSTTACTTHHVPSLVLADPSFCPLLTGAFASSGPAHVALILSARDSSEGLGAQPSASGASVLGLPPSSYVHILCPDHMRSNEPTGVQLLSVTPIVKNGFLVKLPLVRVPFPPLSFYFPASRRPSPHITPAFAIPC